MALADANPGFAALAAAAAHSQGLATRDAGLLGEAAVQHPDPWARASAAEDLAILHTGTTRDQAIRHLKTALDGYRQTGADRDQAHIGGGCKSRAAAATGQCTPPGPSPAGQPHRH